MFLCFQHIQTWNDSFSIFLTRTKKRVFPASCLCFFILNAVTGITPGVLSWSLTLLRTSSTTFMSSTRSNLTLPPEATTWMQIGQNLPGKRVAAATSLDAHGFFCFSFSRLKNTETECFYVFTVLLFKQKFSFQLKMNYLHSDLRPPLPIKWHHSRKETRPKSS